MNEESIKMFEQFLDDHGNKRVIAANGYIYSLIENILQNELEKERQEPESI